MQIQEHNVATDLVVVRAATEQEIAAHEIASQEFANEKTATLEKTAAKNNLLQRLGITPDEARLLLS